MEKVGGLVLAGEFRGLEPKMKGNGEPVKNLYVAGVLTPQGAMVNPQLWCESYGRVNPDYELLRSLEPGTRVVIECGLSLNNKFMNIDALRVRLGELEFSEGQSSSLRAVGQ